jgi:pimeloyl-ACP methyl ester carboxylesterase
MDRQPNEEPMAQRFQASDGIRLAYDITDFTDSWRRPTTLILLHAAMGSARRWYAMIPPLCRHYRVVHMDLRGHGQSQVPPPDAPLTMARLVQDVRELMDHLECPRAHLVGNSAGGYVAQNLAMQSPERVMSLCLLGSTPGLKHSQARSWLPLIAANGLRRFLADTIADRFPAGHDPGHIQWFLDEAAKNDPTYIARFIGLMTTLDWTAELETIACPTLLVAGGAETVGHVGAYETMRDRIPHATLILYEGLPHNVCDIVPERCAADVIQFLGGLNS